MAILYQVTHASFIYTIRLTNCLQDGSVECEDVSSDCPALTCGFADAILGDGKCCMECPGK